MVESAAQCKENYMNREMVTSPEICADICRGRSEMFIYGTTESGKQEACNDKEGIKECECYCAFSTNYHSCLKQEYSSSFNLYAFKTGEKIKSLGASRCLFVDSSVF